MNMGIIGRFVFSVKGKNITEIRGQSRRAGVGDQRSVTIEIFDLWVIHNLKLDLSSKYCFFNAIKLIQPYHGPFSCCFTDGGRFLKMIHRLFIKTLLFILLLLIAPLTLMAGEATNRVKTATDKIIAIVSDVSLHPAGKKVQRNRKIIEVVDKLFSWDEFSRRVLATHWTNRTDSEKKEFVTQVRQYMIGSYIDYSTCYSGEKISYLKEKIDGVYGTVTAEVNISNRIYVPVEIRVLKKNGVWQIYDASVAGLSFVEYYRNQINEIITKTSYKELVRRLKQKGYKGIGQIDLTVKESNR